MPPTDHFPSTHATWIDAQLTIAEDAARPDAAAEANAALRTHLMERYHDALGAYVRTAALVRAGEPAELVNGFFAGLPEGAEFLRKWRQSGMPLRRWVMNAMAFHCRGVLRDQRRDAARRADDAALLDRLPARSSEDPVRAFERAWAVALANEAMAIATADAAERGRAQDADVFRMHAVDGLPHRTIASELGMTEDQAEHAARRVSRRMRDALVDLLRAEGVRAEDLDAALGEVLALIDEAEGRE